MGLRGAAPDTEMVKENVVDKQVLAETQRQLDSSKAARNAAEATVAARRRTW